MPLNQQSLKPISSSTQIPNNFDLSMKVLSWAHLNFELQVFLSKRKENLSLKENEQLQEIGYQGKSIQALEEKEYKKLFEKESFFSPSQTGKRIVSFALKLNGLNQDRFEGIEESITIAFKDTKNLYQDSKLLEQSYQHALDVLYIFKR